MHTIDICVNEEARRYRASFNFCARTRARFLMDIIRNVDLPRAINFISFSCHVVNVTLPLTCHAASYERFNFAHSFAQLFLVDSAALYRLLFLAYFECRSHDLKYHIRITLERVLNVFTLTISWG